MSIKVLQTVVYRNSQMNYFYFTENKRDLKCIYQKKYISIKILSTTQKIKVVSNTFGNPKLPFSLLI